mmetsp:Transcript_26528/g.44800  ORF Transcript_26528/g.44800 Transcript_26528/m.44800 type:complete len:330 (-) Transcript_26528:239-1228(-)
MLIFLKFQLFCLFAEFLYYIGFRRDPHASGWSQYTGLYGFLTNSALVSLLFAYFTTDSIFDVEKYDQIYYWGRLDNHEMLSVGDRCSIDFEQYSNESSHEESPFSVWYSMAIENLKECKITDIRQEQQPSASQISRDSEVDNEPEADYVFDVTLSTSRQTITGVPSQYIHPPVGGLMLKRIMTEIPYSAWTIRNYAILFAFPILITHIIPGMLLYLWVIILFCVACAIVTFIYVIMKACCFDEVDTKDNISRKGRMQRNFDRLTYTLFLRLSVVFLMQTLFNYMVLFYYMPNKYLENIGTEYTLRTQTSCYYSNAFESAESGLIVFGWL